MLRIFSTRCTVIAATVIVASGLGLAGAGSASAATSHSATGNIGAARQSSDSQMREVKLPGESAVCYIDTSASGTKTTVYYAGTTTCTVSDYLVIGDWFFYNYGKEYKVVPTDDDGEDGLFGEYGSVSGGTQGHRNVAWCIEILAEGDEVWGGCLPVATDI